MCFTQRVPYVKLENIAVYAVFYPVLLRGEFQNSVAVIGPVKEFSHIGVSIFVWYRGGDSHELCLGRDIWLQVQHARGIAVIIVLVHVHAKAAFREPLEYLTFYLYIGVC